MNIKLYATEKLKFDKYGYALKEITMEYSYGETFLVYRFYSADDNKCEISIPSVSEVVIKNKNIVKTAIDLMNVFPDDMSTILSSLPDELVSINESTFTKLNGDKEYNSILDNKIARFNNKQALNTLQA